MRDIYYFFLFLFHLPYLYCTRKHLRVLAYHDIKDDQIFLKQINYLKKHYNLIGLEEVKRNVEKNIPFGPKSVFITFDDGDPTILTKALPILKEKNVPSTMFVITDLIGSKNPFWWDEIKYYEESGTSNEKVWKVKEWPNYKRLSYLQKIRYNSGKTRLVKQQLTVEKLHYLQRNGISICNHSHSHPIFDQCTIPELRIEMQESIKILKENNFHHDIFAYPNGNFSKTTEEILREQGISLAFLFDHRINRASIFNPYRISRLRVDSDLSLSEFKIKISGIHSFFYNNFKIKDNEDLNGY